MLLLCHDPAGIYLLKDNNGNTRSVREISSELTLKTLERCRKGRSSVFIVNFEYISYIVLAFPLLNLNK